METNLLPKSTDIDIKFDGSNVIWKTRVQAYLEAIDYDSLLIDSRPRRIATGTDEMKATRDEEIKRFVKRDKKVRSFLLGTLNERYTMIVHGLESSKEIWERISKCM